MDTNLNEQTPITKPSGKLYKFFKLKFIIPVIIAAFLITATFGIVMAKKKFADGPGGFMMGMLVEKLDLNESQKAQVEKIRDEIHSKMESNKDEHQSMMEDFASEFTKDNMDKNKLMELDQKRVQDMKENKDFMIDKMIEFHNILTPQQRQKAVDIMKDMKGKFGHGMHKGPNGRDDSDGSKWKNYKEN